MEQVKEFFDTSTIHGLSWISGTKKWSRLLWIMIVIGGFSGAGYLIYESFYNWGQSPISTTIETLPISVLTLPNVTVCPPRKSFLNLNYDIRKSEKLKIDNRTRNELFDYALDIIQKNFYEEIMSNLSKVEDSDRYNNWYHGYNKIDLPYYTTFRHQLWYYITTSAPTGNISIQYFGDRFNVNKLDGNIYVGVGIFLPNSVVNNKEITLMFNILKRTMKEVSWNDKMTFSNIVIDPDLRQWHTNITAPTSNYVEVSLNRKVTVDDINNMELDMMPGFRLTWNFNTVTKYAMLSNTDNTKEFVR